jgi:probable HAF family extracellular repeat protein
MQWKITDLGTDPGDTFSDASAINRAGQIVGNSGVHAVMFAGGFFPPTVLGMLGDSTFARDINDAQLSGDPQANQVVGAIFVGNNSHAFVWDPGAGMRDLNAILNPNVGFGGGNSEANAINSSSMVVGAAERADGTRRAFLFDAGAMREPFDLSTALQPSPVGGSEALDVNDAGQVVGWLQATGAGPSMGFLYQNNGETTNLGPLGAGQVTTVNGRGQVAGLTSALDQHAFFFDPQAMANLVDLGTLGGNFSQANDINDAGQVVGWADTQPRSGGSDTGNRHAFIWSPGGAIQDLNTVAADASWVLTEATGMTSGGQIVGTGTHSGQRHAWLLAPVISNTGEAVVAEVTQILLGVVNDAWGVVRPLGGGPVHQPPWGPGDPIMRDVLLGLVLNALATNVNDAASSDRMQRIALELVVHQVQQLMGNLG